ncbi:hypothetical protein BML2537_26630 [Providencia stuartii]|nr:hypothetical protein BML2537_26630 [Providencia stuartii]GHB84107.1 hypothetical protein GCM10007290_05570 [Providencia thailandensis]
MAYKEIAINNKVAYVPIKYLLRFICSLVFAELKIAIKPMTCPTKNEKAIAPNKSNNGRIKKYQYPFL